MPMSIEIASNIKGLIFDLDGTLIDSMPQHYQAWKDVFKNYGFDYPEDVFYEYAGMPSYKIVDALNKRFNLTLHPFKTTEEKEDVFVTMIQDIQYIAPIIELVKKHHQKLPMSIGTGGRTKIVDKIIKTIGLDDYFDIVVTADDVTLHKPHPDTFLKCAQMMGVDPVSCLVFEDGDKGIEAAKKAGMSVLDVRYVL